MTWSDELEMIARGWADACEVRGYMRHDQSKQRAVPGGMRVGQNLASIVDYTRAMDMWWSEVKDYNFNTSYMEHYRKGRVIGHYTQMAWANSYLIGCAATKCDGSGSILVCNYGPAGNIIPFDRPYEVNDVPCLNRDADDLCECPNKHCHGGVLKIDDCTCDCKIGSYQPTFRDPTDCSLKCEGSKDIWFCGYNAMFSNCKQTWISMACPHMCNICS